MAKEINCAVIIPFFGRFEQLTLCGLALLDQSHKKFKIVLIDDGSNSKYSSSSYVTKLPKDEQGNLIVRIGHSPDPDDAFMFHAMTTNAFPTPGYNFVHELQDIETLNHRAMRKE